MEPITGSFSIALAVVGVKFAITVIITMAAAAVAPVDFIIFI